MTDATAKPPIATAATAATAPSKRKSIAPIDAPVVKKAVVRKAVKTLKADKAVVTKKAATVTKPVVVAKKNILSRPAKPAATPKPPKTKKPKMVRDSMTMPKTEYAVLNELKLRATKLASPVKKTELLRAGIKALAAMTDSGFVAALKAVPSLKIGRPSKS